MTAAPLPQEVGEALDAMLVACWKGNYGVAQSQAVTIREAFTRLQSERDAMEKDAGLARLLPEVFAERLRDGWSFAYEPGTNYVGLNHPSGGKMSVVRVEYGNYDQQIGEAIAALFNAAIARQEGSDGR